MNKVSLGNLSARFGAAHEHVTDFSEKSKKIAVAKARYADPPADENHGPTVSVVIVYNDMHAALRAAEILGRLGRKSHHQLRQRLMPVPVTQLGDPSRFDHLLSDAHSADMIIVSFNGPGDFPETLKKWIADCLTQKRTDNSAIVALLTSNERLDAPDSPRYQFLKNAAWTAGLKFVAPKPGADEETETASLQPALGPEIYRPASAVSDGFRFGAEDR